MASASIQEFGRLYSDVVEKAWDDPKYLESLRNNPAAVLKEAGIQPPPGATVNVVMRQLDRNAKLADEISAWEDGKKTGVYDIIIPIKPNANAQLIPEGQEGDACCCCPCSCS